MRNAKTPEDRQNVAKTAHVEVQKRTKEKGITLPDHQGPGAVSGPGIGSHTD